MIDPREAYAPPPTGLAASTVGMAQSVMPTEKTLGQQFYHRYYRAPFALDMVQQAIVSSQRNPHIPEAEALAADVAAMTKAYEERVALVSKAVRARQAARAKLNALQLKSAG